MTLIRPRPLLAATRLIPSMIGLAFLATLLASSAVAPLAAQGEPPPLELPSWERDHSFVSIPHPRDVFGFEPGADYELATNAQIVAYFEALDAASERVHVERIGESVYGRPLILAYISSAENIRRMAEWRENAEALAMGRISREEARRRASDGKAIVWIDGGLHSTEVAGAQHTPLLGYRVAGEETEEMRRIRDDVILLLMPVMNPDGLDIVAEWTEASLGTAWEGSSPPVLYQAYTGHDNNRDWFMITQPETRAVTDVIYHQWFPQIVLNQHQTAPWPARIFIPPFAEPVNPHIQPLTVRGVNQVGNAMGTRFSEEGKPGAVARVNFDMWWNGGMRTAPYYHNMIGLLTETAHASVAPRYVDPESLPSHISGTLPARAPSVFYPDPWLGGWFRMRDAVEYMITAAMATLEVASDQREEFLFNIWRMGADAVEAGRSGGPFAYIVAPDQRDPYEAVNMLNVLRKGGVEVHRAERPFEAGGERYPAGSYVVFAGQPFRPHLMDLLEEHVYPDMRLYPGGPPDTPYDISGWTLPIQMGVRTERVDEPFGAGAMTAVDEAEVWPGEVEDSGWGWTFSAESNAAAIAANRLLAEGAQVSIAGDGITAGDGRVGRGAYVVRGASGSRVAELARDLGVDFLGLDRAPDAALQPMDLPTIGLYKSWQANMDEGWTRWVLEEYDFPLDTLHDAEIRSADLSRYDAIILPDQRAQSILHGYPAGSRPDSITGGIGLEGVLRLREYVEGGGRLIAFDGATELLIDQFGIPLRNAVSGLPSEAFFVPGTLIRTTLDTEDPLTYGMDDEVAAFFARSRAWAPAGRAGGLDVVARYAEEDLVLSGWALGEDRLAGRAALVRAPIGAGDVVLFGFRPQFRAQPRGTFKLLFNALHGAGTRDLQGLAAGSN